MSDKTANVPTSDDLDRVMNRLMTAGGFSSISELKKAMGFSHSAFANRKKRPKSLPYKEIVDVCVARGLSIDEILGARSGSNLAISHDLGADDPSPSVWDYHEFGSRLLRLKRVLGLKHDQDVAATLGMSKPAFSDRKRRSAFPDSRVALLASRRPDLGIDVQYVLTGIPSSKPAPGSNLAISHDLAANTPAVANCSTVEQFAAMAKRFEAECIRLCISDEEACDVGGISPEALLQIRLGTVSPDAVFLCRLAQWRPMFDVSWVVVGRFNPFCYDPRGGR